MRGKRILPLLTTRPMAFDTVLRFALAPIALSCDLAA